MEGMSWIARVFCGREDMRKDGRENSGRGRYRSSRGGCRLALRSEFLYQCVGVQSCGRDAVMRIGRRNRVSPRVSPSRSMNDSTVNLGYAGRAIHCHPASGLGMCASTVRRFGNRDGETRDQDPRQVQGGSFVLHISSNPSYGGKSQPPVARYLLSSRESVFRVVGRADDRIIGSFCSFCGRHLPAHNYRIADQGVEGADPSGGRTSTVRLLLARVSSLYDVPGPLKSLSNQQQWGSS